MSGSGGKAALSRELAESIRSARFCTGCCPVECTCRASATTRRNIASSEPRRATSPFKPAPFSLDPPAYSPRGGGQCLGGVAGLRIVVRGPKITRSAGESWRMSEMIFES